jgi:hypothetical protein
LKGGVESILSLPDAYYGANRITVSLIVGGWGKIVAGGWWLVTGGRMVVGGWWLVRGY